MVSVVVVVGGSVVVVVGGSVVVVVAGGRVVVVVAGGRVVVVVAGGCVVGEVDEPLEVMTETAAAATTGLASDMPAVVPSGVASPYGKTAPLEVTNQ